MISKEVQSYLRQEFQRLKDSSPILQSLLESTDYGLALITSDFHVIETNRKMREWFPGADISTFPLCHKSFFYFGDVKCPQCPATGCLQENKKKTSVIECKTLHNRFGSFKVSCVPLMGPSGETGGVLEIVEDVTEKTLKEKELFDLEAQNRQIIELASDAILTFNSEGEILQINIKAQELLGYDAEDVIGRPIAYLIPESRRDEQSDAVKRIFSDRHGPELGKGIEGQCLKKDGLIVEAEITYSLIHTTKGDTITAIIRDISARKDYEKELKSYAEELEQTVETRTEQLDHFEERYRSLVETASDAIISTDRDGIIHFFNKKAEEFYGYERNEIQGNHLSEIAAGEVWDIVKDVFGPNGDSFQEAKSLESHGIKKDRSTFPVEFTISVFERAGDYRVTFFARDITRRKRLEEELQGYMSKLEEKVRERTEELIASQEELEEKVAELSILKEIGEALASTMDLEGVINIILVGATSHHGLGFNRAFLFLVNDEGTYLDGKVAIGPSDPQEAERIWGNIVGKNLSLREILHSYTDKAGHIDSHVNDIVRSIRIPMSDENDILIQAVKKREPINIEDARNHPLVPESLVTLMRCNAFALVPLVAHDKVLGVLWADNAITGKPVENRDVERLRAFAINASLVIEKSNLYESIQAKVMELKENRDRLIRSEKLAAVGEMSATVAHGIRNPLVSIGGFARRLLKKETEQTPNRKYLQIIVEEIDRLESILSELLDFVRPKKLQLQSVDIHTVIENTLHVISYELEKRRIPIEKRLCSSLPMLEIDPDQFKRVLHNLFHNAMEAMPDGGPLQVSTTLEEEWVKVSIADTGVGISDDDIEKVFHPFYTSKPTGSGLGLAVCNQIMQIHGGHLKLRKHIPRGVVFDIYLPANLDEPA